MRLSMLDDRMRSVVTEKRSKVTPNHQNWGCLEILPK